MDAFELRGVLVGADGEKVSNPIGNDGGRCCSGKLDSSSLPPWACASAQITACLQIRDSKSSIHPEEASSELMGQESLNAGTLSAPTVEREPEPNQMNGHLDPRFTSQAENFRMFIRQSASYAQGIGACTSMQDLLFGFASGALQYTMNSNDHQLEGISCSDVFGSSAEQQNALGRTAGPFELKAGIQSLEKHSTDATSYALGYDLEEEIDNETVGQPNTYPGSDADDEETDTESSVQERRWASSGIEAANDVVSADNKITLEDLDWEMLYTTGELVKMKYTEASTVEEDVENCRLTEENTANKDGWKKRRRVKDAPKRQAFRLPKGMGSVEAAMRRFCDKKEGNIFEPRLGLEFDCEAEAFQFYNLYSWEVGFGIRKGNIDGNKDGYKTVREIVCQRQGYDKRTKTKTKWCYCKAKIRLHRTDDDGWFISAFETKHNHALSWTDQEKKEWNSHKHIDRDTRDMIKNLRENNVTLSKVHTILGSFYGSMNNIPFGRRSLKTICAQIGREQREDDMRKTLELFREMRSEDPGFQFSVDLDSMGQINGLIWTTGRSRSNYCCFGDVVTFDTTYCTNLYKMPFGLFVGVNNHFQTTIFAGVLMRNETADSFKWVFQEFLALMGGVHPQTILTDQCIAMEIALKTVMPGTAHLWCKWHVFRDARIELGPIFRDNHEFKDEFHRVITEMLTVDEFTHAWNALLDKYNLHSHHYMVKAYEKREKWAKCYNRDTFCARMTSTQRSESANHMLKTVVPRNSSMNRFVLNLQKLLYQRYEDEEREEHDTKQELRVNRVLWDVEKHAMQIYTRKVFEMFALEMEKIRKYGVPRSTDGIHFIVSHRNAEYVEQYRRAEFKVKRLNDGERYECECGLYEHFGLLCCHVLRVFIHIDVTEIPAAHIMQRWTRKARDLIPENLRVKCRTSSEEHGKLYLQAKIHGKAMEVARKGKFNYDTCEIVMRYLQKAERKVDEFMQQIEQQAESGEKGHDGTDHEANGNFMSSDTDTVSENTYGASGSCAGMSDEEIMNIKAPPRPVKVGAPVRKRYVSFLDKVDKKNRSRIQKQSTITGQTKSPKKKATGISTVVTRHCTICRKPGHNRNNCPNPNLATEDGM